MNCPRCNTPLMLDRKRVTIDAIDTQVLILRTLCQNCDCFIQIDYSSPNIIHAGRCEGDDFEYKVYV